MAQFPLLYQEGTQNLLFRWRRILGWMFNGICSAVIIFFLCIHAIEPQAYRKDGRTAGRDILGPTMYTCVVWVVNCQMALMVNYFTLVSHIVIWGEICFWYIFQVIYGSLPSTFSTTAYKLFVEALAPSPFYWLITLCVVIAALTPYFSYKTIQMRFFPSYHGLIQLIRRQGNSNDPEFYNMMRQKSVRQATVGLTARSLSRTSPLNGIVAHQR